MVANSSVDPELRLLDHYSDSHAPTAQDYCHSSIGDNRIRIPNKDSDGGDRCSTRMVTVGDKSPSSSWG
jgi:hypothetical protein